MKVNMRGKLAWAGLIIVVAAGLAGGYILTSQAIAGVGFPLDDAWIHQTYARNLAMIGEWSFVPGQPSAGSTAPLWSMLLAIGYLLGLAPYLWTYLLGFISLAVLAVVGEKWLRVMDDGPARFLPWAGLFLAGEWHLVWAAASGMETILFGLMNLLVFYTLASHRKRWITGALIGLAVWIRPDGLTLLGPALFQSWLEAKSMPDRLKQVRDIGIPFLVGLAAYLAFNQAVSHTWLPNTFYAKQTEYAILQQIPILDRAFSLLSLPMVGAGIFLLPGFVFAVWKSVKTLNFGILGAAIWWIGYTFLYILRLPVTYQHGRYLIPAMPIFFVLGILGLRDIFKILRNQGNGIDLRLSLRTRLKRALPVGWTAGVVLLWSVMNVVGAFTYAQDVAIIQSEMVAASKWVALNTPANALIGAHDIGALGFFGGRKILDLAGLVSPEVIPIMRDETALQTFLEQNNADYLLTFPSWYPELVKGRTPIYTTGGKYSPAAGGDNMSLYKWR
jgi:hypothetical protein